MRILHCWHLNYNGRSIANVRHGVKECDESVAGQERQPSRHQGFKVVSLSEGHYFPHLLSWTLKMFTEVFARRNGGMLPLAFPPADYRLGSTTAAAGCRTAKWPAGMRAIAWASSPMPVSSA